MKYSDALTWFERDILPQPYMMNKPLLVHLINGEIEIRWVAHIGIEKGWWHEDDKGVQKDKDGNLFVYTWADEECWDKDSDHLAWDYVDYWTFMPTLKDNI